MPTIVSVLRNYRFGLFAGDLSAGLTTAIMLVPQAVAYALLAGVPVQTGLYAAIVPTFFYGIFGRSAALSVGPVALDSIVVATVVAPIAGSNLSLYVACASILMGMVGMLHLMLGFARFGKLTQFLSPAFVDGFLGGAGILIAVSQIPNFLGLRLPRESQPLRAVDSIVSHLGDTQWITAAIGLSLVAFLRISGKHLSRRLPRHLLSVLLGALLVVWLEPRTYRIALVGPVEGGLPSFHLPHLRWQHVLAMVPGAFALVLVSTVEMFSIIKRFPDPEEQAGSDSLDPNAELRAIGIANLAGSFFQCYSVSAGLSRSVVHHEAGARTTLAGLFSAVFALVAAVFLGPVIALVPKVALAAMIVAAVFSLVDPSRILKHRHSKHGFFWVALVSFGSSAFFGIKVGLAIGLVANALAVLRQRRGDKSNLTDASSDSD